MCPLESVAFECSPKTQTATLCQCDPGFELPTFPICGVQLGLPRFPECLGKYANHLCIAYRGLVMYGRYVSVKTFCLMVESTPQFF